MVWSTSMQNLITIAPKDPQLIVFEIGALSVDNGVISQSGKTTVKCHRSGPSL